MPPRSPANQRVSRRPLFPQGWAGRAWWMAGGLVLLLSALLALRPAAAPMAGSAAGPQEERGGFWDLFLPRPDPITDCAGLRGWLQRAGGGFTAKARRGGLDAELQYRPAACMACMEQAGASFADAAFRERVAELGATELYVLRLPRTAEGSGSGLELTEDLRADLLEVVGQDTFPCAFLHVEAGASVHPYRTALVGFDRPQDGRDRRVVLRDRAGAWGGDLVFDLGRGSLRRYLRAINDTTSTRS